MEAFAAVFAHPRLQPGVDADVGVESGAAIKTLAARGTPVRLFLRVDYLVPAKRTRLTETWSVALKGEEVNEQSE